MKAAAWWLVGLAVAAAFAAGVGMVWPAVGRITSLFGEERPTGPHNGIDIALPVGTPVVAPFGGVVSEVFTTDRGGVSLALELSNGLRAAFAHLSGYAVALGDVVERGQVVAYSGNTGNTTGPHLHFTLKDRGVYVDPLAYLPAIA